jgi:uncharacterized membrane protein (DUF373 family)
MGTPSQTISAAFHRFETLIIQGLLLLIAVMILAAFWGLVIETYHLLQQGALNALSHKAFQSVFGMIMTLLIAIEFSHTIMHAHIESRRDIIVKTVILVAILAIARQFIVAEVEKISPMILIALALSLLSLGIVYWLMERLAREPENQISDHI